MVAALLGATIRGEGQKKLDFRMARNWVPACERNSTFRMQGIGPPVKKKALRIRQPDDKAVLLKNFFHVQTHGHTRREEEARKGPQENRFSKKIRFTKDRSVFFFVVSFLVSKLNGKNVYRCFENVKL